MNIDFPIERFTGCSKDILKALYEPTDNINEVINSDDFMNIPKPNLYDSSKRKEQDALILQHRKKHEFLNEYMKLLMNDKNGSHYCVNEFSIFDSCNNIIYDATGDIFKVLKLNQGESIYNDFINNSDKIMEDDALYYLLNMD
jgi:hypothetical protein